MRGSHGHCRDDSHAASAVSLMLRSAAFEAHVGNRS